MDALLRQIDRSLGFLYRPDHLSWPLVFKVFVAREGLHNPRHSAN